AGFGLLALVLAAARSARPLGLLVAAAPLLVSTVAARQRAAVLGLVAAAAVVALAWVAPTARRRLRVTPTEVGLVALVVIALLVVPAAVAGLGAGRPAAVPLADEVAVTFTSPGKQQSAQERVNQWQVATALWRERPFLGHGLGVVFRYSGVGERVVVASDVFHSIFYDLLVRTGLVGLCLFAAAMAFTLRDGVRAWRYAGDGFVAAVALVGAALVVGLLAKGMVESILEKDRLVVAMGLLLGVVRAAATGAARVLTVGRDEERVWS
ncbi:MAG: O-antigen ligase family protein, partial [Acidimicrobiales bacterium]